MVRRWSYIDQSINRPSLNPVSKSHKFKLFRKNTKFKKFNRGLADFVRRKNIKRKKSFNLIDLSYISSNWSKQYSSARSMSRFSQGLALFAHTFQSVQPRLLTKLAIKFNLTEGLNIFSVPSKLLSANKVGFTLLNTNANTRKNSRNSMLGISTPNANADAHKKLGMSSEADNLSNFYGKRSSAITYNRNQLKSSLDRPAIGMISSVRKLLILLSLSNIHRN